VATGPASGIFAVDVDAEESFSSLVDEHGAWTETLAATTSRGWHFYFDWPASGTIRNSAGNKLGEGIHVRGDGGYCVIPPSTHPSGARYEWTGKSQVASAPGWLLEAITSAAPPVIDASEIGVLLEGTRNDGLMRYAGKLRREGKEHPEIELKLLAANLRRCKPPLEDDEVRKIAAGIMRYAPGGLDPLETAWKESAGEYGSNYQRFLALANQLQTARPRQAIALPIERIGELMRVHWNSVSYYRSKAVASGILSPAGEYVPHRKAGLYRCSEMPFVTKDLKGLVTKNPLVTKTTIPLVTKGQNSPSYKEANKKIPDIACENAKSAEHKPTWETPTFTVLSEQELASRSPLRDRRSGGGLQ
jgi:hypothetical protein